jgi:hypothetical protein
MRKFAYVAAALALAIALSATPAVATGVNVTGFAPGQQVETSAGNSYAADATGTVSNVAFGQDLVSLLAVGGRTLDSTLTPSANGLYATPITLLHTRNSDGSTLAASASSGKFGVTVTLGTASYLVSESATSASKTDTALFDVVLPRNYIAGQNITLTTNAQYVLGSATVGAHTLTAHAYRMANNGTQGTDMIATGALSIGATAGDLVSTITGTTLNPGDRMLITVVEVIEDTGGAAITARLNSARLN